MWLRSSSLVVSYYEIFPVSPLSIKFTNGIGDVSVSDAGSAEPRFQLDLGVSFFYVFIKKT